MGAEITTLRDEQVPLPKDRMQVLAPPRRPRKPREAKKTKSLFAAFIEDAGRITRQARQQDRHYNALAKLAEALVDKDKENAELRRELALLQQNRNVSTAKEGTTATTMEQGTPTTTAKSATTDGDGNNCVRDASIRFLRDEIPLNAPPACRCGSESEFCILDRRSLLRASTITRPSCWDEDSGDVQTTPMAETLQQLRLELDEALRERDEARKQLLEEQERSACELEAFSRSLLVVDELRGEAARQRPNNTSGTTSLEESAKTREEVSGSSSTQSHKDDKNDQSSRQEEPPPQRPLEKEQEPQNKGENSASATAVRSFLRRFSMSDSENMKRLWAPIVGSIKGPGGQRNVETCEPVVEDHKNDDTDASTQCRTSRLPLDYDPFDTSFSIDDEDEETEHETDHQHDNRQRELSGGASQLLAPPQKEGERNKSRPSMIRSGNEVGETGVRHRSLSPCCVKLGRESSSSCLSVKD